MKLTPAAKEREFAAGKNNPQLHGILTASKLRQR